MGPCMLPKPEPKPHAERRHHARFGNDRGSVSAEYTVLLCFVSLGCAIAIMALGLPLVRSYELRVTMLLLPFP